MHTSPTRATAIPEDLEIWNIDRLIPSARNARTHSDQQIEEVARSIATFGFMTRILVDRSGVIIAGHARVLAAQRLQLQRIPVVVVNHLSDAEKRAYAIADNQIAANAGWNDELLRVELQALQAEGLDLAVTGFDDDELRTLIQDLEATTNGEDEDAVPEPVAEAVTRAGNIWRMGTHRLLCGDATRSTAYQQLLEQPANLVFTDPPYNVDYQAPGSGATIHNDNLGRRFGAFLHSACTEMLRHTNGALYICMSSSELYTLWRAFTDAGGHWSTFVIWAKSTFTLGRSDYQRQYEPILYGWREGGPHYWCGKRDQSDVWPFDKPRTNDLHPTMKPVALIEQAIWNSSRRGDVVLDPFAGSGSTLIACEKAGRVARVIELAPVYCDVIVRRWQQFSGKEAVLEPDGLSFEQVSRAARESGILQNANAVESMLEVTENT
jgi:DNA modification methylase